MVAKPCTAPSALKRDRRPDSPAGAARASQGGCCSSGGATAAACACGAPTPPCLDVVSVTARRRGAVGAPRGGRGDAPLLPGIDIDEPRRVSGRSAASRGRSAADAPASSASRCAASSAARRPLARSGASRSSTCAAHALRSAAPARPPWVGCVTRCTSRPPQKNRCRVLIGVRAGRAPASAWPQA